MLTRLLFLSMLITWLTACSSTFSSNGSSSTVQFSPNTVVLFKNTQQLAKIHYREIGEVSGEMCQITIQEPSANIATARQRMLLNAAYLHANAVLLKDCQIIHGALGCYQQAICQGSALSFSSQ